MRYVELKPNSELLKKCIEEEETYANKSPENQALIDVEAEAIHMILNGIGNDIYSTVDACPNAKEMWLAIERFGHYAKECRSTKRVKDYAYHKEKMMLYKKKAARIQLSVEQSKWLLDTDEEPDDQQLEAHYMYMAKI
ncbi:hypothetical protein Tco_0756107 [Tanacetum coccineum]